MEKTRQPTWKMLEKNYNILTPCPSKRHGDGQKNQQHATIWFLCRRYHIIPLLLYNFPRRTNDWKFQINFTTHPHHTLSHINYADASYVHIIIVHARCCTICMCVYYISNVIIYVIPRRAHALVFGGFGTFSTVACLMNNIPAERLLGIITTDPEPPTTRHG